MDTTNRKSYSRSPEKQFPVLSARQIIPSAPKTSPVKDFSGKPYINRFACLSTSKIHSVSPIIVINFAVS